MGLSSHERFEKFIWGCIHWRRDLRYMLGLIPADNPKARNIVQGWIDEIDLLQGKLIKKLNATGAYWLFGSKKDSYKSFFDDHYDLASIAKKQDFLDREAKRGSLEYYSNIGINKFVELITDKSNDLPNIVALFWDAYQNIDFIFYGVFRYRDDLFEDVEKDLITFIGRFCNERFDLFCEAYFPIEPDMRYVRNVEQIILCKYKLFSKIIEDKKTEARNAMREELSQEKKDALLDDLYEGSIIINDIVEYLAKSSLAVITIDLQEREDAEYEKKEKADAEYEKMMREKGGGKKINPIFGAEVRSYEELLAIVDSIETGNVTVTKEEYESARKDLEVVYSSFCSSYDECTEYIKAEKAKQATKKPAKKAAKKATKSRKKAVK